MPSASGGKPISTPFRLTIPYVGEILAVSGILLVGVIIAFLLYTYKNNLQAKKIGIYFIDYSIYSTNFSLSVFG